ncbi:MAG: BON domain-containing protein [Chloroflexota bacterium]
MADQSALTRDEQVSQAIEEAIQTRMQKDASPINVAVQGATVTLTGHVANQETKDALNELARGTPGVLNVTDNLVIGGGHRFLDWLLPTRDPNRDLVEDDAAEDI